MAKTCCCTIGCIIATLVIGVLLTVAFSVLIGLREGDNIYNKELHKQLVLGLDSPILKQWTNPPSPIHMQYWFFNITNPANVLKGGKPNVDQVGPFTYRLYQTKTDVSFYTNDTVSYKNNYILVFNRSASIDNDNLVITQINIPLLIAQNLVSKLPSWSERFVSFLIQRLGEKDAFVSHTIREWLFGYEDPMFHLFSLIFKLVHVEFPNKFGLFYGFNNSADGIFLAETGQLDYRKANHLLKWNGMSSLPYWSTQEANMINGTDGNFMPPNVNETMKLYAYNTDLCRSIYLVFRNHTSVHGIKTLRFYLPADVFANATTNPANAGFCVPKGNCLDAGVLDVSSCKRGAPIVLSAPHFYMAAKKYVDAVGGLHPNKHEHETYLDVEPTTGFVFTGMERLQVNVHVKPSDVFPQLRDLTDVILPVLWLNKSVTLDEKSANKFKNDVLAPRILINVVLYVFLAVGVLLTLVGMGLIIHRYATAKNEEQQDDNALLVEDDDS